MRNVVAARVVSVTPDVGRAVLVELDIGRTATLLARITARASQELALAPDKQVWALIKAVSLRGTCSARQRVEHGRYSMVKPSTVTAATAARPKAEPGERFFRGTCQLLQW